MEGSVNNASSSESPARQDALNFTLYLVACVVLSWHKLLVVTHGMSWFQM